MNHETSFERGERLESKVKNYCCADFKKNIGGLYGMNTKNNFTLELIDGCENEYYEEINYCFFCGKPLKDRLLSK